MHGSCLSPGCEWAVKQSRSWQLRKKLQLPVSWRQSSSAADLSSSFFFFFCFKGFLFLPPPPTHPVNPTPPQSYSVVLLSKKYSIKLDGWMYPPAGEHSSGFHLCLLLLFLWVSVSVIKVPFPFPSPSLCFSSLFPFIAIFLSAFFRLVFFMWI